MTSREQRTGGDGSPPDTASTRPPPGAALLWAQTADLGRELRKGFQQRPFVLDDVLQVCIRVVRPPFRATSSTTLRWQNRVPVENSPRLGAPHTVPFQELVDILVEMLRPQERQAGATRHVLQRGPPRRLILRQVVNELRALKAQTCPFGPRQAPGPKGSFR